MLYHHALPSQFPSATAGTTAMGYLVARTSRNSWPGGKLPYQINVQDFPENSGPYGEIMQAIDYWNSVGLGITIVPRNGESDYMEFITASGRCSTKIGFSGGRHAVGCDVERVGFTWRTLVHELGHVVGLVHEAVRPDADAHITIHYNNICPGFSHNFSKPRPFGLTATPFDFGSSMMYPPWAFSRNGEHTITLLDGTAYPFEFEALNALDRVAINCRYPLHPPPAPNSVVTTQVRWMDTRHYNCIELPFPRALFYGPDIVSGIQGFDVDANTNVRVHVHSTDIFTDNISSALRMSSWSDTKVFSIYAGWIGLRSSRTLQTGKWSSEADNGTNQIISEQRPMIRNIKFATSFETTPRVLVVLSKLNANKDSNLRVRLSASNITSTGFDITTTTDGDSLLFSVHATWIATTEPENIISMGYFDSRKVNFGKSTSRGNEHPGEFSNRVSGGSTSVLGLLRP